MRYHFTLSRITIIKKTITSVSEDVKKLEFSHITHENVNDAAALKKSLAGPQNVTHRVTI